MPCDLPQDSPQICHKPKRTDSDNGGFMRGSGGRLYVAKTTPKGGFVTEAIC